MQRRREYEKKGSEIRSAIEELSVSDGLDHNNNAPQLPIKPFLFLCKFMIQVLDKIGPTMVVLRQDIHQNIQRLERLQESNPSLYSDVVEMLKIEESEGNAKKGHSCSKAFVWLTRSLDFTVTLLQLIAKDFTLNMEQAVAESYSITLKPWHGWISSTAYRVAIKLVPDNKTIIAILMAEDEDHETFKEDIGTFTSLVVPLLDKVHTILIARFYGDLVTINTNDSSLNMEQAMEESYSLILKPWHGWISSTAYRAALKLKPDNKTLIAILMAKDEDHETLKEDIATFTSHVVPLLDEIHSIMLRYNLDRLKSA